MIMTQNGASNSITTPQFKFPPQLGRSVKIEMSVNSSKCYCIRSTSAWLVRTIRKSSSDFLPSNSGHPLLPSLYAKDSGLKSNKAKV